MQRADAGRGAHRDDRGAIAHAEMSLGPGMIMFGRGGRASGAD
jgi:uncharacterized glyoxalase superfamily protein PhnB